LLCESNTPRFGECGSHHEQATKTTYPEQIVRQLGQADRLLGENSTVADACRELSVTEQTYYRWRNQYGGMKADYAKRLKELEKQKAALKRLLAEAELSKAALKKLTEGNF
jgi:putative transposase